MNAETRRVRSLFLAAVEGHTPDRWSTYLDGACAGDADLRRRVEVLLQAHGQANSLLDLPAPALDATADETIRERPGSVIGPYILRELIGEGGMGLVFVAEQTKPVRRKVALKVIKPGMDTRQVIARFEAERQALALMDHPHIARVFDGGATPSGRLYFVMELVKGVAITQFCDEHRLTTRERLGLFMQICHAVQHAHQKGVIHRDLKPSNVLVTSHDGTPVVKVIDFGVAKAVGPSLTDKTVYTQLSQMVGTPLYMSPEQAGQSGLDIDTRTDVYALGVLLYELLTGTTPFDGERLRQAGYDEMRRILREEEPARPSTRLSTLGQAAKTVFLNRQSDLKKLGQVLRGELDWVVMKALEKDRNRRYETASAFAADVQRYLHDEPVQACPPSAGYRLSKFIRRNKGAVLATGLVFLVVLGGVVGTTLGMIRAWDAEQQEKGARERAERERDAAVEARKETFDALIDLSDFTDQHLLFDQKVWGPAEQEFLHHMDALYNRLGATLVEAAETRGPSVRSQPPLGQIDIPSDGHIRGLEAWRQAADLYPGLAPAKPAATAKARDDLRAYARKCRAVALTAEKLRRWPEAIAYSLRQLESAREALEPGARPNVEIYNLLLTGNWCLTVSLTEAGQVDQAQMPWEEMVRLLAWSEPGGINVGACEHLSRIATKLTAAGKAADPAAVLAAGLAAGLAQLTADPTASGARIDLRRGYRVIGLIHEKSRKFDEALEAFDKTIAVGDAPPAGQDSWVKQERDLVSGALIGRAICLDVLGREADAEEAWSALSRFLGNNAADWSEIRAIHLARNGKPERAARIAEEICLRPGGIRRYNAACVFATASADRGLSPARKGEFAGRAVALLGEAKAAGFFNHPTQVTLAKTDGDLDPIREREDFKKWLARLEAGEPKEKKEEAP